MGHPVYNFIKNKYLLFFIYYLQILFALVYPKKYLFYDIIANKGYTGCSKNVVPNFAYKKVGKMANFYISEKTLSCFVVLLKKFLKQIMKVVYQFVSCAKQLIKKNCWKHF